MDIEKLLKKRNLNVQEQNAIMEHRIFKEASYWRGKGLPKGLKDVLLSQNIDLEKSIILNYEQDFPGISTDEGTIVTEDNKFFRFEMDLSESREQLIELYRWEEFVTEVNHSKKGIGATWGFLALKVLKRLNSN